MNALLLPSGNTFIADTYVNHDPTRSSWPKSP
ncbi:NADP-dependent malic enzyme [Raoultella terrigena]|uniref:NADP-dependent malic enzyme n=1 Tax=Raoultella terrigena TaxID=577 RepID=A0A4U9CXT1_RAOTE|nr:NADP-dependent malic enzyme [Raoultella terrigena]